MINRILTVAIGASIALGGGVETVAAQDTFLEEIIVSARKREESIQDAPVAVSAFTAADFEDRQIASIEDIARFTPGFSFSKAFGRATERPVIRGLGNVLAGVQFGVEAGAAYFVDGVYYPGDIQSLDLRSVDRIEVIRGPQSALYGRNTYSGAINFVTADVGGDPKSSLKLKVAQDDEYDVSFRANGSLTDNLAGGVALRHYENSGGSTKIPSPIAPLATRKPIPLPPHWTGDPPRVRASAPACPTRRTRTAPGRFSCSRQKATTASLAFDPMPRS